MPSSARLLRLAAAAACACCAFAAPAARATATPSIASISPNNGPLAGGTLVQISGSGFTAGSTVRFGSAAAGAVTVESATSIRAVSPAGAGLVAIRVSDGGETSAAVAKDQFAYDPPPSAPWLGLNGNASSGLGPLGTFVAQGIVYDRSGPIDWLAGELPVEGGRLSEGGAGLERDYEAGMTPVVTIEYRGYDGDFRPDPRFPTERDGSTSLREYVEGFVASATAIMAAHPGEPVLFEPMNEPWGYTTPQDEGGQYAAVIARLLPAAQAAGIPLSEIYVAGYGRGWIPQMYRARPALESEIQGWYFHPYGPPGEAEGGEEEGIASLPRDQAEMTSGQNNVIVSEIGYCARNVNGAQCGWPATATGAEAAEDLTAALENALPYHRAGWLRALLVYSRNDGGWAMQFPGGALTDQGRALEAFAAELPSFAYTSGFGGLGVSLPSYFGS